MVLSEAPEQVAPAVQSAPEPLPLVHCPTVFVLQFVCVACFLMRALAPQHLGLVCARGRAPSCSGPLWQWSSTSVQLSGLTPPCINMHVEPVKQSILTLKSQSSQPQAAIRGRAIKVWIPHRPWHGPRGSRRKTIYTTSFQPIKSASNSYITALQGLGEQGQAHDLRLINSPSP